MKKFKNIFKFYVLSNFHVALCAWALTNVTGLFFKIDTFYTSVFVGAATFIAYNLIRFLKIKSQNNREEVSEWFKHQIYSLFILNFLAIIVLLVVCYKISILAYLVVCPFALLTLFYMVAFGKVNNKKLSIRNIPGLKIFCISISWAGICVIFPIVAIKGNLDSKALMFFVAQFLFVLVLTIPFDIRDLDFDSKHLKTLPQIMGENKVKILGGFLLLISLYIHYFMVFENMDFSTLLIYAILLLFLMNSKRQQSQYYASFWVESIPLMYLVCLCVLES